mmetsp:Transcript_21356/g.52289  ORF Transcript_21356/g.52289 Transcript_21356/m.52289 type:complete len:102 (+) Transcript_21356:115-420(+)
MLVDYSFADEGSVVSDPKNGFLYFSHPNAHDRSNLTIYRSIDDAVTWPEEGQRTIYPGSAAYSDMKILNPYPEGEANIIGVIFERDSYAKVSFALSIRKYM